MAIATGTEIEKKFLIAENARDYSTEVFGSFFNSIFDARDNILRKRVRMRQGYLPVDVGEEVIRVVGFDPGFNANEARLRDAGGKYFLTLKAGKGLSRSETPDHEISQTVFDLYWPYARNRIEKVRLTLPYRENKVEFDAYSDRDLIVAEVETESLETAAQILPLGRDVTEDESYKNKSLARPGFHRKFILTGPPCSGKSTTINYIEEMNYVIVPESARSVIEEQLRKGGNIVPWEKFLEFQLEVLSSSLKAERAVAEWGTVFLDRGIPDALAYCVKANITPPKPLVDAVQNQNYQSVFVLDLLPYKQDEARREDAEEAKKLHEGLLEMYSRLGHSPIRVPANSGLSLEDSVRNRAHFIIGKSHRQ